jgi:hypothetical protein
VQTFRFAVIYAGKAQERVNKSASGSRLRASGKSISERFSRSLKPG